MHFFQKIFKNELSGYSFESSQRADFEFGIRFSIELIFLYQNRKIEVKLKNTGFQEFLFQYSESARSELSNEYPDYTFRLTFTFFDFVPVKSDFQ